MITRTIDIEAPIQRVYDVISDLEAYPQFLSTTSAVKTWKKDESLFAEFSINVIKEIRYTLRFEMKPPHEVTWDFVEGDLMTANQGSWTLEKLSEGETRAHYAIDVKFGWMVPKAIVKKLTEVQLPELLQAFKERAEQ